MQQDLFLKQFYFVWSQAPQSIQASKYKSCYIIVCSSVCLQKMKQKGKKSTQKLHIVEIFLLPSSLRAVWVLIGWLLLQLLCFQTRTYQGSAHSLILNAPIATKVACFSRLLKCLWSLYGKQCGPRSDCSYRSSLFWVQVVCFYTKSASNARQLFAADDFSRRHFQMLFFFFKGQSLLKVPDNICSRLQFEILSLKQPESK